MVLSKILLTLLHVTKLELLHICERNTLLPFVCLLLESGDFSLHSPSGFFIIFSSMFLTCLECRQLLNVGLCELEQTSPLGILGRGERKCISHFYTKGHFPQDELVTFTYWMTDFSDLI